MSIAHRRHRVIVALALLLGASMAADRPVRAQSAPLTIEGSGAGIFGETFGSRGGPCGFFAATSAGAVVEPRQVAGAFLIVADCPAPGSSLRVTVTGPQTACTMTSSDALGWPLVVITATGPCTVGGITVLSTLRYAGVAAYVPSSSPPGFYGVGTFVVGCTARSSNPGACHLP